MAVAPGEVVGGRYSVTTLLARGGMADVYRAHDMVLDRWVALKAFRADTESAADAQRFERETQLLARLDHPNLVRLLDAGYHGEARYLVLELVEGPTLAQRLRQGPLGSTQAREVGRDLARALAYVHGQGVVHRDVKPSNVLLTPDGRALLSDFGIAQLADGTRITATRATIGTVAYLAPEQVGGDVVTGAADVYTLGLLLIEALSGRQPFDGTQHEMVAARIAHDPDIPEVIPPSWARLLRAMTRRDPEARPAATVVAAYLATPSTPDAADDLAATEELPDIDVTGTLPVDLTAVTDGRPATTGSRPATPAPVWLAALVPFVLLAAFFFASARDGTTSKGSAADPESSFGAAPGVEARWGITRAGTASTGDRMVKAVRQAMMPEPLTIAASTSLIDAARRMRTWDIHDVFVVDDHDRLVGRLTNRDIAVIAIAAGQHPAALTAGECCDASLPTVTADDPTGHAAELMHQHKLQRLPVVEDGHLIGTVWATDLPPPGRPSDAHQRHRPGRVRR